MSSYVAEHASALADVQAAGTALSFVGSTTVSGYALGVAGLPKRYQSGKLIETSGPVLFFVPSTYGERPALNAIATWAGDEYVVKDEKLFAPNGTAIASYVSLER